MRYLITEQKLYQKYSEKNRLEKDEYENYQKLNHLKLSENILLFLKNNLYINIHKDLAKKEVKKKTAVY
jgi:hypothetical protein